MSPSPKSRSHEATGPVDGLTTVTVSGPGPASGEPTKSTSAIVVEAVDVEVDDVVELLVVLAAIDAVVVEPPTASRTSSQTP